MYNNRKHTDQISAALQFARCCGRYSTLFVQAILICLAYLFFFTFLIDKRRVDRIFVPSHPIDRLVPIHFVDKFGGNPDLAKLI